MKKPIEEKGHRPRKPRLRRKNWKGQGVKWGRRKLALNPRKAKRRNGFCLYSSTSRCRMINNQNPHCRSCKISALSANADFRRSRVCLALKNAAWRGRLRRERGRIEKKWRKQPDLTPWVSFQKTSCKYATLVASEEKGEGKDQMGTDVIKGQGCMINI